MGKIEQLTYQVAWGEWADGHKWKLTPGVDHYQPARAALKNARMWAYRNGKRVVAELPPVDAPFHAPWTIRFVEREASSDG